jgi:hypothetical protein
MYPNGRGTEASRPFSSPPQSLGVHRQPLPVALPESPPALHGWSSAGSEISASLISSVDLAGCLIRRYARAFPPSWAAL